MQHLSRYLWQLKWLDHYHNIIDSDTSLDSQAVTVRLQANSNRLVKLRVETRVRWQLTACSISDMILVSGYGFCDVSILHVIRVF